MPMKGKSWAFNFSFILLYENNIHQKLLCELLLILMGSEDNSYGLIVTPHVEYLRTFSTKKLKYCFITQIKVKLSQKDK